MQKYNIYGDNIVECERMFSLLCDSLEADEKNICGNLPAPTMSIETPKGTFVFQFYPGFGRWENDVISMIRSNGGVLREAPDVILTKSIEDKEIPVLAVEFCSALPAGNQAWQRSGRAYSTARPKIPYLFVTEIGGYELDANRKKKAPRLPNPAIPFSFISYSILTEREVTIAYTMNPGADSTNKDIYKDIVAGNDLLLYIKAILLEQDTTKAFDKLQTKVFSFVSKLSANAKASQTLNTTQWETVYSCLKKCGHTNAILRESSFGWKKKYSIKVTKTFASVFNKVSKIATAVGSKDLPFCVIESTQIQQLSKILSSTYKNISTDYLYQISSLKQVAICWINGFKPKGDDARPDRGLLPFLRMLLGDQIHVLTFVYGPAKKTMINKFENKPEDLTRENGLWEAVLGLSDFIICDSKNAAEPIFQFGKVRSMPVPMLHCEMPNNKRHFPVDTKVGEQDVDSVIHFIFSNLLKTACFEAMCNPPGGDWSGVSLLSDDDEYRWLTLPRVSATASKRPDHVIQLPSGYLISIESKDYLRNLEANIGPRLNQYCKDLFATPPSCCKKSKMSIWNDEVGAFRHPALKYISGGAFITTATSDAEKVLDKAKTDFAFLISFSGEKTNVKIVYNKTCPQAIKDLFEQIQISDTINLSISKE